MPIALALFAGVELVLRQQLDELGLLGDQGGQLQRRRWYLRTFPGIVAASLNHLCIVWKRQGLVVIKRQVQGYKRTT